MYCRSPYYFNTLIISALILLPTTIRPIDTSAWVATGALVGTICGAGTAYYLNEKNKNPKQTATQPSNTLQQFLQKHPTLRNLLYITIGASTGALTTYGFLRLLHYSKTNDDKPNPDDTDTYAQPREETKEDHDWWQNLTKQSTFANEAEIEQSRREWSLAIEHHFVGKPDKIKIYLGILKQLIASEKRIFVSNKNK